MEKELEDRNPMLSVEKLTPLEERLKDKPEMAAGLKMLKETLGDKKYEKYISTIKNMNKRGEMLLVVADSFFQRSMMERECIPVMKEAFKVNKIQIVG